MTVSSLIFYIPLKHLDFDIEKFVNGELGLSGTDSQIIHRALSLEGIYNILIFSDIIYKSERFNTCLIQDLDPLIQRINKISSILILNFRNDENTKFLLELAVNNKLKTILWCQNGPYPQWFDYLNKNPIIKILTVSKGQADYLRHCEFFERTSYIYNSLYTKHLEQPIISNKNIIYYIGSLTPSKGFHLLAKIWKRIKSKNPDALLRVIGSGKLYNNNNLLGDLQLAEANYEEIIKKYLGNSIEEINENGVYFLGLLSPAEIRFHLSQAYIGIVNPNLKGSLETFCVSAIEFQANGIPVLGGNKLGLKETVKNKKTGLLHNSIYEFEENINKLLKSPTLRARLSNQAREYIPLFDETHIRNQWIQLIEDIMNDIRPKKIELSFELKSIIKELFRRIKS
jgi:glycosyltransferase involved in cell wall biosynthesis